jgi:hypothetical protein
MVLHIGKKVDRQHATKPAKDYTGMDEEEVKRWRKASYFVLPTEYCQDESSKEDEMCAACIMHGEDKKCIQNFGRKSVRQRPPVRSRQVTEE